MENKELTEQEKVQFIVQTELDMLKAMRNGEKLADGDRFTNARKRIDEYRKELNLVRPEQKIPNKN